MNFKDRHCPRCQAVTNGDCGGHGMDAINQLQGETYKLRVELAQERARAALLKEVEELRAELAKPCPYGKLQKMAEDECASLKLRLASAERVVEAAKDVREVHDGQSFVLANVPCQCQFCKALAAHDSGGQDAKP